MTNQRKLKVFISYSTQDRSTIRSLGGMLIKDGIDVWLDYQNILPGEQWDIAIEKAISSSDAVIVCLSNNSMTREGYVQREFRYALDLAFEKPEGTIYIIPVRLDECDLPRQLRQYHYLDLFSTGSQIDRVAYNRLLRSLQLRAQNLGAIVPLKEEKAKPSVEKRKTESESQSLQKSSGKAPWTFLSWLESLIKEKPKELAPKATAVDEIILGRNVIKSLDEVSKKLGIEIEKAKDQNGDFVWNTKDLFYDLPILNPLPILVSEEKRLTDTQIEKIKDRLIKLSNPKGRISMVYLACDLEAFESTRAKFIAFSDAFAYDVIMLHPNTALEIIRASEPRKALRHFILSRVNIKTISPYTTRGPTPEDFFFGREHEMREITNHIDSKSYAIIGGRRIGKTSVLNRLHKIRFANSGFTSVFYDCSLIQTSDNFLNAQVHNWQPPRKDNNQNNFGDLFNKIPKEKPFVLLLDEADKLIPIDRENNWKLFNIFRYLSNSKQMQIVLGGERTLREALKDPQSPLFNFPNEILLGPLDYESVKILVTRPMQTLEIKLEGVEDIVNRIWEFTSGHPNVVQGLCTRLVDKINQQQTDRKITIEKVEEIIHDMDFLRMDYLETYWVAASNLEKIITLLLAGDQSTNTLSDIRSSIFKKCGIEPSLHQVDQALRRLIDLRAILMQSSGKYYFAVKSFPTVLSGTMTLSDMLEISSEQFKDGIE